jgi:hypothetical protein
MLFVWAVYGTDSEPVRKWIDVAILHHVLDDANIACDDAAASKEADMVRITVVPMLDHRDCISVMRTSGSGNGDGQHTQL